MLFKKITILFLCAIFFLIVAPDTVFSQQLPQQDSITVSIAPDYDKVGKFHRSLFGEGYRKLWAAPVKLKIFYLAKEKGGMTILKKGGGLQTKSLRLKDAAGNEWALRTIQKYPEQGLPENLKAGLAKDILQDQVVTAHPFASLTVPLLADALGIPHAHPEIVYVPDDPLLGEFRKEFGNAVFLLEEREPLEGGGTDNTDKTQKELQEDNDTRLDQQIVLRARLLDMILGDWDRHEDQWRWQKEGDKNDRVYKPVPRDRDMVYYNTSGVFPWIVSHQWLNSKWQGFHPTIRDIKGFNVNARYFDRYFLNALGSADWDRAIEEVQAKLSDSLIERSIRAMPDTIFALSGQRLINTIIARRNNIAEPAKAYYRFISTYVDIPATDKREAVEIYNDGPGTVTVDIYKIKKDGTKGHSMYTRSFDPSVTKEIRVYGFGGDDIFKVNNNQKLPIKIRLVGGLGDDSFQVAANSPAKRKLLIYDLRKEHNSVVSAVGAKLRLSNDSSVNEFDKKAFKYDRFAIVTLANYSPDEGLILIGGFFNSIHGFRKQPHAFFNELLINYSIGRETFIINYFAEFKNLIGKYDLGVNFNSRGPKGLSNFFGLGNESVFENKGNKKIGYYRSRYDYINADVRLYRDLPKHWRLSGGVALQYYTSRASNNKGKFFEKYNGDYPGSILYHDKTYAGLIAGAEMDTRNSQVMPSGGAYWNTTIRAMKETGGEHSSYGNLLTEFSFYCRPFKTESFILANRVGAGTTVGQPAIFQQLYLGGKQSLRGFHSNRFAGKTILYNNLEMRIKLFDFNSYLLPGTVGLIGFNDIGRVWLPGESSSKWHDGYGGGIYIMPANLFLIQAAVGFSKEGSLPYISIGFRF